MPGAYVDVSIEGTTLADTVTIPRTALDGGDRVWVVGPDDELQSRTVRIGWRHADEVVVTGGLEDGARVIVSPLALPIEGMKVEPVPDTSKAEN